MTVSETVTERCSCGATLTYRGSSTLLVPRAWREEHKHPAPGDVLAAARAEITRRKAAILRTYERGLFQVGSAVEPGSRDPDLELVMNVYDEVLVLLGPGA